MQERELKEKQTKLTTGKWVEVQAPATIANLVCGFDVLGLALNNPSV
jgi:hypothetical protein